MRGGHRTALDVFCIVEALLDTVSGTRWKISRSVCLVLEGQALGVLNGWIDTARFNEAAKPHLPYCGEIMRDFSPDENNKEIELHIWHGTTHRLMLFHRASHILFPNASDERIFPMAREHQPQVMAYSSAFHSIT